MAFGEEQDRGPGKKNPTSGRLPATKAVARRTPGQVQSTPPTGNKLLVLSAVGVLLVLGVVAGVFLIGREEPTHNQTADQLTPNNDPEKTAASAGSSETTRTPKVLSAAEQLTRIQADVTPDLRAYIEICERLDQFLAAHPGTPEAQRAAELRSEIEGRYTKLAEEALTAVLATVKEAASKGAFQEAESKLLAIGARFGQGAWFESKGKAAVDEALAGLAKQREAWALKRVAGTLQKAREQFAAGQFEEAGKLIVDRTKWPAEARAKADGLASEIERKLAAIEAAKKLKETHAKAFAEFDRLMLDGEHAAAKAFAETKVGAEDRTGEMFRAARRVAAALDDEPAARIAGAKKLVGKEVRLKLVKGSQTAIVKGASDTELEIATTFSINGRTSQRPTKLKWEALHPSQLAEFAKIGGLTIEASDASMVSAYTALSAEDFEGALTFVNAAADHVLAERLASVVRARQAQKRYESAMKRVQESMAGEKWSEAIVACEEALTQKPGDTEAADLLAEARRRNGQVYGKNLLVNGGAEFFPFAENGWTQANGSWKQLQHADRLKPKKGKAFFGAGSSTCELYQDVSVAPYSDEVKSGTLQFEFEGYVAVWHESMRLVVEYRDSEGKVLGNFDTGNPPGKFAVWQAVRKTLQPPAGTVTLRVRLLARKRKGRSNNSYCDDLCIIAIRPNGSGDPRPASTDNTGAAPTKEPTP